MRVLSAIGARPQFIKAAPVSAALQAAGIEEVVVHSGQHYDQAMSQVFFDELGLRPPDRNLGVGSASHGVQTARMLEGFEAAIEATRPDWVLVHGDTNSTIAAALAAVKLGVKVAHNEAGLRSFNRSMPEEHNRVLTDHCSDMLLCPTRRAVEQLAREGIDRAVHLVGDVMYDAALHFEARAQSKAKVLDRLGIEPQGFDLATLHRPYNVDDPGRLATILEALAESPAPVVLPCHPRLRARLNASSIAPANRIQLIEPLGYLEMLVLEKHARMILTDSGGVQKEAYIHGVPCITLRPETEWLETVESGWNCLAGADPDRIRDALTSRWWPKARPPLFGDGRAAEKVVELLVRNGKISPPASDTPARFRKTT